MTIIEIYKGYELTSVERPKGRWACQIVAIDGRGEKVASTQSVLETVGGDGCRSIGSWRRCQVPSVGLNFVGSGAPRLAGKHRRDGTFTQGRDRRPYWLGRTRGLNDATQQRHRRAINEPADATPKVASSPGEIVRPCSLIKLSVGGACHMRH